MTTLYHEALIQALEREADRFERAADNMADEIFPADLGLRGRCYALASALRSRARALRSGADVASESEAESL